MESKHRSNAIALSMQAREMSETPVDAAGLLFTGGLISLLGASGSKAEIADLAMIQLSPVLADLGLTVGRRPTQAEARLTTDDELATDNARVAKSLIEAARFLAPDPIAASTGLLTAATTLIEREVGRGMASAALAALLTPTVTSWLARQPSEAMQ
jgi:hypothetical protein